MLTKRYLIIVGCLKTHQNTKITENENKLPIVTGSVTTAAALKAKATEIDNKIPDTITLVKKSDFNTKITAIKGKQIAYKTRQLSAKLVDDLTKEFGLMSSGRLINGYSILNVANNLLIMGRTII